MTEEIEANGEFQSQDSRGIENASDKNEANTDDEASGGIRKWWKRRNKEQRGSKNKERIPTKKSKMKDAIEKLLSTEEEREVLIGEKNYCINKLSEKTERILKEKRDSEKRNLANQEQLLETIELLKTELEKKDQMLTRQADLMNNKLEQERKTVRQSKNRLRELQKTLGDEQQARLRLEEELSQARETRAGLERRLENEHLLRETSRQGVETKEEQARLRLEEELRKARDTIAVLQKTLEIERSSRELIRRNLKKIADTLQQERKLKLGLEKSVRDFQIQIEEEINRTIATEREMEREREIYQQRLDDEQQARLRLEEELHQARETHAERTQLESNRNFYSKNASSSQV